MKRLVRILFFIFVFSSFAFSQGKRVTPVFPAAGITLDSSQYNSNSFSGSTINIAHTVSGSNRYLIVAMSRVNTVVDSVTYNGVAMTKIGSTIQLTAIDNTMLDMWGLVNPATGTNNVSITPGATDGPHTVRIVISSWTGVNQTTPIGTPGSTTKNSQADELISTTITSATGEVVVDAMATYSRAATKDDSSQTLLGSSGNTGTAGIDASYKAGAPSVTLGWNWSGLGNQGSAQIVVALKP